MFCFLQFAKTMAVVTDSNGPICNQTERMAAISGNMPGDVGSYILCPLEDPGVKYCIIFAPPSSDQDTPILRALSDIQSTIVGVCVPANCSYASIAALLEQNPYLASTFNFTSALSPNGNLTGQNFFCTGSEQETNLFVLLAIIALCLVVAAVILATVFDYLLELSSQLKKWLKVRRGTKGEFIYVIEPETSNSPPSPVNRSNYGAIREEDPRIPETKAITSEPLLDPTQEVTPPQSKEEEPAIQSQGEGKKAKDSLRNFFTDSKYYAAMTQKRVELVSWLRSMWGKYVLCFSLIQSFKKWRFFPADQPSLNVFNSFRLLCWVWIVTSNTYTLSQSVPTYGQEVDEQSNVFFALLQSETCATYAISTFLLISGFTTMHKLVSEEEANASSAQQVVSDRLAANSARFWKGVKWYFLLLLRRFVRLLPLYGAVILITQTAMLHVGSGPFWSTFEFSKGLNENCGNNVWTNFAFINNFFPSPENRCFPWCYYFALEFQFFAMGPVVYYLYKNLPKRVHFTLFNGLLLLLSCLCRGLQYNQGGERENEEMRLHNFAPGQGTILFVDTANQQPQGMLVPFLVGTQLYFTFRGIRARKDELHMFGEDSEFTRKLLQTRTKIATADLSGRSLKSRAMRFFQADALSCRILAALSYKSVRIILIWVSALLLCGCVIGSWALDTNLPVNHFGRRFFFAISILIWSISLQLFLLPMLFGYGGMFHRIFTHRLWCGGSRLVYAAYLLHPVVISYNNATKYAPQLMHFLPFLYDVWGNAWLSLLIAFCFHLTIEQPCIALVGG